MKVLRFPALLVLGLVLATGLAWAEDLAPAALPAPVCDAPLFAVADAAQAPQVVGLFTPEPQPTVCPLIGCVNDEYCRRNQDCTSAPNGVCNLFCPTKGCCSYQ